MSLRKEDNEALEEIKVGSFWCESGGRTRSNPAPEGRSQALKSLKPPWFGFRHRSFLLGGLEPPNPPGLPWGGDGSQAVNLF